MSVMTAEATPRRRGRTSCSQLLALIVAIPSTLACTRATTSEDYSTRSASFDPASRAATLEAGLEPVSDAGRNVDADSLREVVVPPHSTDVRDAGYALDAALPASIEVDGTEVDGNGIDGGVFSTQDIAIDVCAPGTFVATGAPGGVRECVPCEPGTYSATVNSDECEAWTECEWAPVVAAGTSSQDVECEQGGRFRQFGSVSSDTVSSIAVGPVGDVLIAGLAGDGFPGFPSYASNACYVAAYTPSGHLQTVSNLACAARNLYSTDINMTLSFVQLLAVGTHIVAIWVDPDRPSQLVASSVPPVVGVEPIPETRVALGLPDTEFPLDGASVSGAAALGPNEFVVVVTYEPDELDGCGTSVLVRVRIGEGLVTRYDIAPRDPCVSWDALAVVNDQIYLAGSQHFGSRASGVLEIHTLENSVSSQLSFDASLGTLESLVVDRSGNRILAFATPVDAVVQKYDATGQHLWSTTLRGAYHHPRLFLSGDEIWVTGGTDLVLTDVGYDGFGANYGSLDAYLARLTQAGELTWLSQFGSVKRDAGRSLATLDGRLYLAGVTNGVLASAIGDFDGFLVQVNPHDATVE